MTGMEIAQAGGIFFAPTAITVLVWWFHLANGQKTNINNVFIGILGGAEFLDLSWLPKEVVVPLVSGLALAALVANNILTARE